MKKVRNDFMLDFLDATVPTIKAILDLARKFKTDKFVTSLENRGMVCYESCSCS